MDKVYSICLWLSQRVASLAGISTNDAIIGVVAVFVVGLVVLAAVWSIIARSIKYSERY